MKNTNLKSLVQPSQKTIDPDLPTVMDKKGIYLIKKGKQPIRLSNFSAQIIEEIEIYDGQKLCGREYNIEVFLRNKKVKRKRFTVDAEKFRSLSWVDKELGADAIITNNRTHMNYITQTIQRDSEKKVQTRIQTNIGFMKIGKNHVFCHPKGMLKAPGHQTKKISVKGNAVLNGYGFSTKLITEDNSNRLIQSSLSLLNISKNNPYIGTILLSSAMRAVTSHFHPNTVTPFIIGRTGSYKSSLAALAQSFYGREFNNTNLPALFNNSTAIGIERMMSMSNQMLVVIDDYFPSSNNNDENNKFIERLVFGGSTVTSRKAGNGSGSLEETHPISTTALFTGEVALYTDKVSRHMRVLYCPVDSGDIDEEILSEFQVMARRGEFENFMKLFIQYILAHYDKINKRSPRLFDKYRMKAQKELPQESHARMASNAADMALGIRLFLDFCIHRKAITNIAANKIIHRSWSHLIRLVNSQKDIRTQFSLAGMISHDIYNLLLNGKLHLHDVDRKIPPSKYQSKIGWIKNKPQGDFLGYINFSNKKVYIPNDLNLSILLDKLHPTIQQMLGERQNIIWKKIDDSGLLAERDGQRKTVRRAIRGKQETVYSITLGCLFQ